MHIYEFFDSIQFYFILLVFLGKHKRYVAWLLFFIFTQYVQFNVCVFHAFSIFSVSMTSSLIFSPQVDYCLIKWIYYIFSRGKFVSRQVLPLKNILTATSATHLKFFISLERNQLQKHFVEKKSFILTILVFYVLITKLLQSLCIISYYTLSYINLG